MTLAMREHRVSERQACKLLEVDRSTYRYQPRPDHNAGLREALIALAREKPRFGYRRLWVELTRKQGWTASIGRVHRLYRAEHLAVRRLKRKRLKGVMPANPLLTRPNQEWALDFVSDALSNGTRAACADHGGQLHAGVPGDRGGHGDLQPAGDADIGTGDSGTWQAAHSALRQRAGVHQPAHPGLVRGSRYRTGAHSAGPADAERARGKLQRPVPR